MLKISYENWDQSPESLRSLALNSDHPRTRERFLALFEIATGKKNATQISKETNRNHQTDIPHLSKAICDLKFSHSEIHKKI
jgi:hypothetical protein